MTWPVTIGSWKTNTGLRAYIRLLTLLWGHILNEVFFVPRVINVSHGSVHHKRDSEVHLCPPDLPTDHLIVGISRTEWDYLYTKLPMSSCNSSQKLHTYHTSCFLHHFLPWATYVSSHLFYHLCFVRRTKNTKSPWRGISSAWVCLPLRNCMGPGPRWCFSSPSR